MLRTVLSVLCLCASSKAAELPIRIQAERLASNPIIREDMLSGDDGGSINGPTLIRVPEWVHSPLGKYYLYFSHHGGKYIRLAYADQVEGPWKIHSGGVLALAAQSVLAGHVASPDAVVDESFHRIVLCFHGKPAGVTPKKMGPDERDPEAGQKSVCAVSEDGLHFQAGKLQVGPAYLRLFHHGDFWYAINAQTLSRAARLGDRFVPVADVIGPEIADALDPVKLGEPGASGNRPQHGPDRYSIRHVGIDLWDNHLLVYFSCVGHRPERILCTSIRLSGKPETWRAQGIQEVLRPEEVWEGVKLPLAFSHGGRSKQWERGLRDPFVFVEQGKRYLVYSTAGEHGLGLARLSYGSSR